LSLSPVQVEMVCIAVGNPNLSGHQVHLLLGVHRSTLTGASASGSRPAPALCRRPGGITSVRPGPGGTAHYAPLPKGHGSATNP